jgi:tRNA (guanine-N7-)-methyltransferase
MRNPKVEQENLLKYVMKSREDYKHFAKDFSPSAIRLEIGSGNGQFLVQLAASAPEELILGCDIDFIRIKKTVRKLGRENLENVRLCRGWAEDLLEWIEPASLTDIYVNFPDPWPKKRHHPRRFFYDPAKLGTLYSKLKRGGKLYFVSDHEEYFNFVLEERLKKHPFLQTPFEDGYVHDFPGYFSTLYEEKFRQEGKKIYYTFFEKM